MKSEYDFIVIGGGSGGYAATRTAVEEGLSVAVIEGGEQVAGLCILRGCMPSKALIESANRNLTIRRAREFGLRADLGKPVGHEIIARKNKFIEDFAGYRRGQLEAENGFDFIRGVARLDGPRQVVVKLRESGEEIRLNGKTICLATGSVISQPPVPGLAQTPHYTSDNILFLEDLPESAIVLGGGAIAVEMAHYLEGLGVKITLIQRSPHILKEMDHDLSEVVENAFRQRGMKVYTGTKLQQIQKSGSDGVKVEFLHGEEAVTVEADLLLNALGRRPATNGLGLDEAGVEMEYDQIQVAKTQQSCTVPHIFAAGDVCGPHEVVHLAIQQGEIAARNAARIIRGNGEKLEEISYRMKIFGVFCEPQAAIVGLTEQEAMTEGYPHKAAKYPFDDHGKSLVRGEPEGFVKLIAHPETGKIIGGAAVGAEATEIIHEIAVAMYFGATALDLAKVPHYHPTLSEIWTYPAEELAGL